MEPLINCDVINVENKPRNSPGTDPCRTPEVTGNTPEDETLHTRTGFSYDVVCNPYENMWMDIQWYKTIRSQPRCHHFNVPYTCIVSDEKQIRQPVVSISIFPLTCLKQTRVEC